MNNENDDENESPIPQLFALIRQRHGEMEEKIEKIHLKQDRLLQSARCGINDLTDRLDGINEREAMALTVQCHKISNRLAKALSMPDQRMRDFMAEFILQCVALYRVRPECDCENCTNKEDAV